jgi:SAM-dependent methyltransferase
VAEHTYTNLLALFGIGGAHPGGLELTKEILMNDNISGKRLLEIGCGTGQSTLFMHSLGVEITSIDSHPLMIEKANSRFLKSKLPIRAEQKNIENAAFSDASFDIVLSESVLSFTNIEKSLPQVFRVLKKEGVLYAIEMTKKATMAKELEEQLKQFYGIPAILLKSEWEEKCKSVGFMNVDIITYSLDDLPLTEPEIDPSINIEEKYFKIMHQHEKLTKDSKPHIEVSIIKAQRF